ncbi:SEL1-like repeat protein [Salinarimonas rosea]|uniref:SEL1-like repeat protein n=1 Tax=Salinarimonas rosea TaxID=552063 RepID=UPI00049062E1|nr:SEL1-like repeat protein [Salinarimonas rosea]
MRQNVSQSAPWGLDGLDPEVRDAAREAARRAGMSVDEWLSVAIADRATRTHQEAPVRRRAGQPAREPHHGGGWDELDGVASRLGKISRGEGSGAAAPQARAQASTRNIDQVIASLTAEQDRRARESAAKTAEALDSVARWIERAEDRMSETTRSVAERQDRTATVLGEALGLMTRRLDDIDRRVAEGHQPSMKAALDAVAKVETHLATLETRRREETSAARDRDAARETAIDEKIERALRGFEERIATISERIAETAAPERGRGRRGLSVRDELKEAVAEIRSRQQALEDPEGAAAGPPAALAARFAPRAEPAPRDGRSHAEILEGLRADISKLAGQLDSVRPRDEETAPAVEGVRRELAQLRETVSGLATRGEVGALEDILRTLSRETAQAMIQAKLGTSGPDATAMGATLSRLEGEVRRLSEEVQRNAPHGLVQAVETISHKVDLIADAGLDPQTVQALTGEVADLRGLLGEIAEPSRVGDLAERVAELSRQVERIGHGQVDPLEFAGMRAAVEDIREHLTAPRPETDAAALGALGSRIDTLGEKLEAVTGLLSRADTGALARQIEGLAASAATLEAGGAPAAVVDLGPLASQIEALGARLDALSAQPAQVDVSPVAQQIELLEKRLGARQEALAPAALVARLDVMAEKLDALREAPRPEPSLDLDGLMRRLDRIDERLSAPGDDERLKPLEAMLAGLAAKLEEPQREGSDGLEALERHITQIAARLERERDPDPALAALERSMGDLMAQVAGLEEGLREGVPVPAKDDAFADLSRTIESLKVSQVEADRRSRDTLSAVHGTLEALVGRLASLEAGTARDKDVRRQKPTEAPAARKPSGEGKPISEKPALDKPSLDKPGIDKPSAPAAEASGPARDEPAMPRGFDISAFRASAPRTPEAEPQAPVLDTAAAALLSEADAPAAASFVDEILLEPGSGRPQPGKSRRTAAPAPAASEEPDAGDIKASFIAAARRAAQSAAAEAAAARSEPAEIDADGASPASLAGRMKRVLARRRKPLLLGLAAIVLAIGALQVSSMLQRGGDGPIASVAPPAQIATEAPAPIGAPAITIAPEAEAPAVPAAGPTTTQTIPPADAARVPSFMGLPAAPLSNGIPAGDLVIPAPTSADAAREIMLPPRRDEATAFAARIVPSTGTGAAAAPIPTGPVSPLVAGLVIPDAVASTRLREAARAGDEAAVFELAARLSDGRDAPRDPALAARLFERLAEQGVVPAQYRIGQIYDKGVGVARDPAAAEMWYRRAAESGNVTAMHNLAVLLAEGAVAGAPDYTGAIGWFRRAAEHGVRDSQYNLAVLLARGLGAPQDLPASYTWFAIAAAQGDTDASARQEELAQRLDEPARLVAQSAADAWRPETPDARANEVALPAHGWNDRSAGLPVRHFAA